MYFCQFQSVLAEIGMDHPGNVKAYSWTIRHRKRDMPQIKIVMLLRHGATMAAVFAIVAGAFEDIDSLECMLTMSEQVFEAITAGNRW